MSGWIASFNAAASEWGTILWRASWQAGIAILAVWALCRFLPRLPAPARCWLWRAAYAKLFFSLCWGAAVALPVLPKPQSVKGIAQSAKGRRAIAITSGTGSRHVLGAQASLPACPSTMQAEMPALPGPTRSYGHSDAGGTPALPGSTASPPRPLAPSLPRPSPAPTLPAWLFLLWLAGVGCGGIRLARAGARLRRLSRGWMPATDPALLDAVHELGAQLGLRRAPTVRLMGNAGVPMVAGWTRPVLALPPALLAELSPEERRLILAHELAHLKRRDLAWGWLPLLARLLFFFHPLVWLAEAHWRLAQEVACDELALRATRAPARPYGELLLKVAARCGPSVTPPSGAGYLPGCGVVESLWTLERRLAVIHTHQRAPGWRWLISLAASAALAVPALVPWRVVAQTAEPPKAPPPRPAPVPAPPPGAPAALPAPATSPVPAVPPGPATLPPLPTPAPPGAPSTAPLAPALPPPGVTAPAASPVPPPPAVSVSPVTGPVVAQALPPPAVAPGNVPPPVALPGPGEAAPVAPPPVVAQAELQAANAAAQADAARVARARAQLQQSQGNFAPAAANLDAARAALKAAEANFARMKQLADSGSVTQVEVEKAEAELAQAKANVVQAEAQLRNQRDTVVAAEAQVEEAEAQLERARAVLDQARASARAPARGPNNALSGGYGASAGVPPELAEARLKAARQAYEQLVKTIGFGTVDFETLHTWSRRILDAQTEAAPRERVAALEAHLARMRDLEKMAGERYKTGNASPADVTATEYYRIEAETWLAQARRGGRNANTVSPRPAASYSAPLGGGARR